MNIDSSGFFNGLQSKSKTVPKQLFHTTTTNADASPKLPQRTTRRAVQANGVAATKSFAGNAASQQLQDDVVWFEVGLCKPLVKAVCEAGYITPTPIQAKAIPAILQGYDVCGRAVTGSGKTAAFLLPVLHRIITSPGAVRQCIRAVIVTPTRELAVQCQEMTDTMTQFCRHCVVSCIAVGGIPLDAQAQQLRQAPELVVGTPGRLIDLLRNQRGITLDHLELLVFDEADKLLSCGYSDMIHEILRYVPKSRQTLLFSATMTRDVDTLAKLALQRPLDIDIGHVAVASQLNQEFVRVTEEQKRSKIAMLHVLCTKIFPSRTLVFAKYVTTVRRLKVVLELLGVKVAALYGELGMEERLQALEMFGQGQCDVLVATELAARGLDIPGVDTVINYDMPTTLTSYIHRVGRTARIGNEGRAVSFVGPFEEELLAKVITLSNSTVGGAVRSVKRRDVDAAQVAESQKRVDEVFNEVRETLKLEDLENEMKETERKTAAFSSGATDGTAANATSWFEGQRDKRRREKEAYEKYRSGAEDAAATTNEDNHDDGEEPEYTKHTASDLYAELPKSKRPKKTAAQKLQAFKDERVAARKDRLKKLRQVKSPLELKGLLPKGKFKRVRKTEERRARHDAIRTGQAKARPTQRKRQQKKSRGQASFKSKQRYKRR